eukprot:6376179-Amphidinium_carterae.1
MASQWSRERAPKGSDTPNTRLASWSRSPETESPTAPLYNQAAGSTKNVIFRFGDHRENTSHHQYHTEVCQKKGKSISSKTQELQYTPKDSKIEHEGVYQ